MTDHVDEHLTNDTDTHGHDDLSTPVKWSNQWWATVASPTARRCKAHRKTGERCGKAAMDGQFVCGSHGGRAPQAKRKARERLEEASDRIARSLLKMATDDKVSESVRLSAMKDVLDRAGISAKTAVDVEIALKPWEQISAAAVESLEVTSRAAFRASQGQADDGSPLAGFPALGVGGTEPIDAEIVDADEYDGMRAARPDVNAVDQPEAPGDDEHARAEATRRRLRLRDQADADDRDMSWVAATAATPAPTGDQYVTVVEGAEQLAELRRAAAQRARDEGYAVIRRPMRALPPGRSARG